MSTGVAVAAVGLGVVALGGIGFLAYSSSQRRAEEEAARRDAENKALLQQYSSMAGQRRNPVSISYGGFGVSFDRVMTYLSA